MYSFFIRYLVKYDSSFDSIFVFDGFESFVVLFEFEGFVDDVFSFDFVRVEVVDSGSCIDVN